MKLSIVIPVYNEEKTIREILNKVKKVSLPKGVISEIVVVNDASSDGSLEILKSTGGIRLFSHKVNQGKGSAVKTGISKANGDIILIQDADLEYDPSYYRKLISPIISGRQKVVFGSRLKNYPLVLFGKRATPMPFHYVGNKLLTFVTNLLYGNNVTDMETCYKVFAREVLEDIRIEAKRFDFEPEITAKILKKGYRIFEVPIKVYPRGYDEGKKITWKDGIGALWTLIKYRFTD